MEEQKETPQPNLDNKKKTKKTDLMEQYENRFEAAVTDAQFMMIYASTNCPNDIDQKTTKTLVEVRQRIAKGDKLSPAKEAEFWLSYQKLWKLVQPKGIEDFTVTAESIKANMPLEKTFFGWLFGLNPALYQWTKTWTISKSRKSVNRYITFTVFVLVLLLVFQIYWVVGNQLLIDLDTLSKSEVSLSAQLGEFKSNPDFKPDSGTTQASVNTELNILKSKNEGYTATLRFWSKAWDWLIPVVRVQHHEKFSADFAKLDGEINDLNNKIKNDSHGTNEATVKAQQTDLGEQLKNSKPPESDRIQKQIDRVSEKSALDSQLIDLKTKNDEFQKQINSLNKEKDSYQQQKDELDTEKQAIQDQIYSLNREKESLQQQINNLEEVKLSIENILKNATTPPASLTEEEMKTLPQDLRTELEKSKENGDEQILSLKQAKRSIEEQLIPLNDSNQNLAGYIHDLETRQQDIQGQIAPLSYAIDNLTMNIDTLILDTQSNEDQIKNLESLVDKLKLEMAKFSVVVDPAVAEQIVKDRQVNLQNLENKKIALEQEEKEFLDVTDTGPARLAGKFVLDIIQTYLLPILYGLLGAGTSVLRSLSRKIKEVTYSEAVGIQHLLSISLGVLAGIMVGLFSFLLDANTTTFLGSVSPLAIAFLIGYNIETFFSRMDDAINTNKDQQPSTQRRK